MSRRHTLFFWCRVFRDFRVSKVFKEFREKNRNFALGMVIIDILFIILLAGGAVLGFKKGAIKQLASVVAVAAAIIACRAAGPLAASIVVPIVGADDPAASSMTVYSAQVLGYGGLFLIVWLGVWLIAGFFRKATYAVKLSLIDRIAGAVFLPLKWFMVVSLMLNLWKMIYPDSTLFSSSKLVAMVMELAPAVLGALKEVATNTVPELFNK